MIRKLELKDKNEYFEMCKKFYSSSAVIEQTIPKYLERTFNDILNNNPYVDGYVQEIDWKIAGYMMITFSYSNEFGCEFCIIDELYIKDEYQGMGLGSEMLDFVEKKYLDQKALHY